MLGARYILLVLLLAGCSSDPAEDPVIGSADASDDMTAREDFGGDAAPDVGSPDVGPTADADGDTSDMSQPVDCTHHAAAACMADPACMLDGGCVRRAAVEPFQYLQTGAWVGTARITDQTGPSGTTEVVLALHRDNERDVRGVVSFPEFDIDHTVWGGVGPTGELGLYFGTPRCADPRCDVPFDRAYDVGGVATDLSVVLDTVVVDPDVTDFQTFIDMELSPSDGFKPVGPIVTRSDVLVAQWLGDMVAVDESGELLDLHCDFEVSQDRDGAYEFKDFFCGTEGVDLATNIDNADPATLAYANGLAWFATGPAPDDLAFVGRVRVEDPWQGVVARRGDLLDGGVPIDPEDVPIEAIRGTFGFYAFNTSP